MDTANLIRELEKIQDVLVSCNDYFDSKDTMNAALHMAKLVRSTPLAASVDVALDSTHNLIAALKVEEPIDS